VRERRLHPARLGAHKLRKPRGKNRQGKMTQGQCLNEDNGKVEGTGSRGEKPNWARVRQPGSAKENQSLPAPSHFL